VEISGRFEWLTIPQKESKSHHHTNAPKVIPAKSCPGCGWLDSEKRFERLSGEPGIRECWRCGLRWDVSLEVDLFLQKENIRLPPVELKSVPDTIKKFYRSNESDPMFFDLYLQAEKLNLKKGFDELICLNGNLKIIRMEHQIKTALTVLRKMRCRALLADEVGLGKTIEAGIIIKELIVRGLIKNAMILVPAGLCRQWKSEVLAKFDENFLIFTGRQLSEGDRKIIVSYDLAKRRPALLHHRWDLLVLDEVHSLKNRGTALYKFVEQLKSRFILGLSATPVQNSIDELYSIVNLIEPGMLGTIRSFKRKFIPGKKSKRFPHGNECELKELLTDVMIRNRRDTCDIRFPRRSVGIYYIEPSDAEKRLYESVSGYVREEYKSEFLRRTGMSAHMLSLIILQRELMSTPLAVMGTLNRIARRPGYPAIIKNRLLDYANQAGNIKKPSKLMALKQQLIRRKGERIVIFSEFVNSVRFLKQMIGSWGFRVMCLTGGCSSKQRSEILSRFKKAEGSILVSTEAGGVGLNLQFCRNLINYDLPWNPQRIEQRVGRIDRIGQEQDQVCILNLVCRDTIEEHVIDILAKKLRMFELVIGEVNDVLGKMPGGRSFERLIFDAAFLNGVRNDREYAFQKIAANAAFARTSFDHNKRFNSILNQFALEA
jgi:SNF2 family DNA or RNA helicase